MVSVKMFKFNKCDFFLLAWVVYYLQGILYPTGSVVAWTLLAVNLLYSFFFAFKVQNIPGNPSYIKGLNLLIIMFTIYGLLYMLFNPSVVHYFGMSYRPYMYLKSIFLSLLPIYAFYYFTRAGYLTSAKLRIWGIVFIMSVILSFFQYQQEMLQKLVEIGSSREEITNNSGYLFLSCLPLLVLYKQKPILQFLLLAIVMAFIVAGMKRGAIIVGAITTSYFVIKAIKSSKGSMRFLVLFLSIVFCIGIVYYFIYLMSTSDYMVQRIESTMDGNSSGRDEIYSFFWRYFSHEADALSFLVGKGANGTLAVYSRLAHNDWLEIAVNHGVVGLIVYLLYWIYFSNTIRKATNDTSKNIMLLIFLILFVKTFISMSYSEMTYVNTSVLGFALANMNTPNEKKYE